MKDSTRVVLFEARQFTRSLPRNVTSEDDPVFRQCLTYESPDVCMYWYESVKMLPDSTLFNGIIPKTHSFLFYKKRLRHHSLKGILDIRLRWKKLLFPAQSQPYVVIHDAWTTNYYHWITQALPRLLMAQMEGRPYRLLLPEDHNHEFHKKTLSLLGVKEWTSLPRGNVYYQLQNLRYPGHDIQVGDYHESLMIELTRRMRTADSTAARGRIFIHRNTAHRRKIVNEAEVLQIFASEGFQVVELEKLSFEEQLRLMAQTQIIAGVHGAGLTNMMFMPARATVFELTTRIDPENFYFFNLSAVYGHKYYYQHCSTNRPFTTVQEADLNVDVSLLRNNLELILSDVVV